MTHGTAVPTGDAAAPLPADGVHVERVARSGGLSLAGAAVSALAGLALVAAITNGLDRATAGTVFATTSAFLILVSVAQLGTEVGIVRWLPVLVVQGRTANALAVLRAAVVPVLLVSLAAAAAVLVTAPALAGLVAPEAPRDLVAGQLRALALLLPVAAVLNVVLAASRGLRTMRPTVVVESLGRAAVQLVSVVAVLLLGLGPVAVVLAWALPYAAALAAAAAWLLALLRRRTPGWRAGGAGAADDVRGFWRFTGPRALGTTSQAVLKRIDIVLVAALQSPGEAALYAAATRFVVVGQLGVQALQQALGPLLSGHFAGDDRAAAREVYRATTAWAVLLSWPVYLGSAAAAPLVLRLFGDGYDAVAPVVVLLSAAMLVATAAGAVDTVLLMSGHAWLSLGNNLVALVLNLALNVWLIPRYGALGAGIAWSASIVVRNVLPLVQIAVLHRVSPFGSASATAAALSVACFGIAPLLLRLSGSEGPEVLLALVLGVPVFVLGAWLRRDALRLDAFRQAVRSPRRRHRSPSG